MALAQRPGPRFFAAFYRWSRHTYRPGPCTLSSHTSRLARRPAALAQGRSYHATCRMREEDRSSHGLMQDLERSATAAQSDTGASLASPAGTLGFKENVRRLMRKVPSSVAVVTVAHADSETNENVPMGIAVSSLSTVTLDPPTISFNVKLPSQALDAIRRAGGHFRVHWLNGTVAGRNVVELFCKGNNHEAYEQRRKMLDIDLPQITHGPTVAAPLTPRLRGPAIRAAAACTLTHELDVGDHVILVAQVVNLESYEDATPTIAYVDGTYRKLGVKTGVLGDHLDQQDSTEPATHQQDAAPGTPKQSTASKTESAMSRAQELSMAFDWPVIPGKSERSEYAERLKSYLKTLPGIGDTTPRAWVLDLQDETRLVASSLGISLVAIHVKCQGNNDVEEMNILPEFYGRLSPADLAKLAGRTIQFVKADQKFLQLSYLKLLHFLDVRVGGSTLLPSDLLNPLRAAGLIPPFEPSPSLLSENGMNANVLVQEQVEHVILEELSRLTDEKIMKMTARNLFEQAKLQRGGLVHFGQSLIRLKVQACKSLFTENKLDIAGELSSAEARVVIRRLVEYLAVDNKQVYRELMGRSPSVLLRRVGVHPLITGVNFEFVINKIRYLYSTTKNFVDLRGRVEEMLQPYFATSVTWEDLESRIEQFVQELPLRATTWTNRDVLAAMGLSGHTLISTPVTETPKSIEASNLFDMLMAKALKKHYGSGTDEENKAIATFLQDRYGFDVTLKPVIATPEEALKRSSAEDMDAAMAQQRAETVRV